MEGMKDGWKREGVNLFFIKLNLLNSFNLAEMFIK